MNNSIAEMLKQIAENELLIYNAGVKKREAEISAALDDIIATQNSLILSQ